MSSVRDSMPRVSIRRWACVSESALEVRYGMRTPMTLFGPSARAASVATTAESTPPETPTTAFWNPRRVNSSFRKVTSQDSTRAGAISRGGGAPRERSPPARTDNEDGRVDGPANGNPELTVIGRWSLVVGELPDNDRSSSTVSFGSIVRMSESSGESARAFVMSSRSTFAVSSDSSNTGALARVSPCGPITSEPPWNIRPPSLPTSPARVTNTPCSSAMSRISRSHRATLPGTETPSARSNTPRAGEADETNTTRAPPGRVERANRGAALHEPRLVEQTVRRKERLPVNVEDLRAASAANVGEAVVEVAVQLLVEADHRVDRRAVVRGG